MMPKQSWTKGQEVVRQPEPEISSVDRLRELQTTSDYGAPWLLAYRGSAVLNNAEQHLRSVDWHKGKQGLIKDAWDAVQKLRNARTDLKAVMEYLDGIAEVQS